MMALRGAGVSMVAMVPEKLTNSLPGNLQVDQVGGWLNGG